MTADQARELFSAAYEAELDAAEQAAFDAALAADAALSAHYAAFVETLDTAKRALSGPPAPVDLLAGVQKRVRARSRGRYYGDKFSTRLWVGLLSPLSLAIVMLLLAALAWLVFSYAQSVPTPK